MTTTPVPAFVAEVREQARAAHEARMAAMAAGDHDAVEVAAARLADLADVVRRYAADLVAMLDVSPLLDAGPAEGVPLRVAG